MAELSLNKPAGVLIKTTLVDYPGLVAGSFFLKGCNLRCPYCYNIDLVEPSADESELNTVQELFDHMEKRQGILSGIVISGGEPLINPYTQIIVKKAKELGYKVKIDTNGILPQKIKYFLDTPELRPNFMAMDIKTSLNKYSSLLCTKKSGTYLPSDIFSNALKESAKLISQMPSDSREFRTVLVPTLIKKEDIKDIASILPKDASWQFAQFRNENCLDPTYNEISPYIDSEIKELIDYAKTLIPGANLR
ncbi:MAG: anaerobic ribonucleoside-triphosphate reductase activating protein [Treponema sp.]|nr:anaerobic ribonucleoside-triphosphate reductase activating protein [Treponema sp.]